MENKTKSMSEEMVNEAVAEEVVNEIMVTEDIARANETTIEVFKNPQSALFSSIVDDGTRETKIKVYNAINSSDDSLSDHIGKTIEVQDMVAHAIQLTDEVTGELIDALRVVLISPDGKAYASVSMGIVGSLQKILPIVGQAPWTPALKVVPTQVKTRKGFKTLTLRLEA